jgi:hypothetical protein
LIVDKKIRREGEGGSSFVKDLNRLLEEKLDNNY